MSLQTDKTDKILGEQVNEYLKSLDIQTPCIGTSLSFEQKRSSIELKYAEIMDIMGLDRTDDSLCDTPKRMSKMYLSELFWGLDPDNFPKCTVVDNKMKYDEMIMERNIQVSSTCEHHMVSIQGFAHVAYIPSEKIAGLSKINRVVEYFSRRPQIQERLTAQIYYALSYMLGTENIAVCIQAEHLCVKTRGVEDVCSDTVTSKLGGVFKSVPVRAEFYSLISLQK